LFKRKGYNRDGNDRGIFSSYCGSQAMDFSGSTDILGHIGWNEQRGGMDQRAEGSRRSALQEDDLQRLKIIALSRRAEGPPLKPPSVTAGSKAMKPMAVVDSSTTLKILVSEPLSPALDVIAGDISRKLILKDVSDGRQEDQSVVDTGLHGEVPGGGGQLIHKAVISDFNPLGLKEDMGSGNKSGKVGPMEDVGIIGFSSGLVNVPISQELLGPSHEVSSKFPDSIGGIGHDGIFAATVQNGVSNDKVPKWKRKSQSSNRHILSKITSSGSGGKRGMKNIGGVKGESMISRKQGKWVAACPEDFLAEADIQPRQSP